MIAQILVADDDAGVRSMIRDFLLSRHHRVLEASDGAQAFAMAEKEMPHLIIMDVVMAGLYGTTAAGRLRDYWRTSKIPVILISGSTDARALGIEEKPGLRFLRKPFKLEALGEMIREMLPAGGYTP